MWTSISEVLRSSFLGTDKFLHWKLVPRTYRRDPSTDWSHSSCSTAYFAFPDIQCDTIGTSRHVLLSRQYDSSARPLSFGNECFVRDSSRRSVLSLSFRILLRRITRDYDDLYLTTIRLDIACRNDVSSARRLDGDVPPTPCASTGRRGALRITRKVMERQLLVDTSLIPIFLDTIFPFSESMTRLTINDPSTCSVRFCVLDVLTWHKIFLHETSERSNIFSFLISSYPLLDFCYFSIFLLISAFLAVFYPPWNTRCK